MQVAAIMEQSADPEGQPGVTADQGLGVGVHRGMHSDPGFSFQELGAETPLAPEWQTQRIAVEFHGPIDVLDENGGTV